MGVERPFPKPLPLETYLSNAWNDLQLFQQMHAFRGRIEPNWVELGKQAEREVDAIPRNAIDLLFRRTLPEQARMSAGHSLGHEVRDIRETIRILHKDSRFYPNGELAIGMFGGTFHDLGNSVSPRTEEEYHITPHATRGAYQFLTVAHRILPDTVREMSGFAIMAHTNEEKGRTITVENTTVINPPYYTEIDSYGNRLGIYLSRKTDQAQIRGIENMVRHMLVLAEAKQGSRGRYSDFIKLMSVTDLTHHGLLDMAKKFIDQVGDPDNWHNKGDTQELSEKLFYPQAIHLQRFVDEVTTHKAPLSSRERQEGLDDLYKMCRLLEPAFDTEEKIDNLRVKFETLDIAVLDKWARGFRVLAREIYPEAYEWYKEDLEKPLKLPRNSAQMNALIHGLQETAVRLLPVFDPTHLDSEAPTIQSLLYPT